MDYFKFKHFGLHQNNKVFKFSTDAMLLGALANPNGNSLLDIGSGTGVLSLMMAQKASSILSITAIDINPDSVSLINQNFFNYHTTFPYQIIQADFLEWSNHTTQKFDTIICNPPFYQPTDYEAIDKRTKINPSRFVATNEVNLPLSSLIINAIKCLNTNGLAWFIIPFSRLNETEAILKKSDASLAHCTHIKSYPNNNNIRTVLGIIKGSNEPNIANELTIYKSENQYSDDYIQLTKDFYAKEF